MSGGLTLTALSGRRHICKATSLGFRLHPEGFRRFRCNCIDDRRWWALDCRISLGPFTGQGWGQWPPGVSLLSGAELGGILSKEGPPPLILCLQSLGGIPW